MAISLFQHNAEAYEAALLMLGETGKAAIVHPTGTGKSFIGFKLCEDNPDKTICWLSPSEYIFKTQLENLKAASDGYEPENVQFFTYAKLMLMSEEEISDIEPDYIILDEFHRCGAEMWGRGVQNLLNAYPDVSILGLSATNIRYLDNQRDMADELFDGNIASEMTLGEAIVRGILNPPKYVLSMFCYQDSLEKYEMRVKKSRNKIVRDTAEIYLEELRRTLEKADGLDVIFDKHMTDRTGKYIVFCANKEHMDDMMSHTEWFARVDKQPHMYSVYTPDPSASQSFDDFKADNDNTHLRLLYCIDALNEGIHVDDISGVILLRPTVSPIIYKQQIGRALSASKKTDAVIFDVVLNIENLYSIGAIEEEMEIATTYYRFLGEKEEIVNERFTVIDEVRDCRALFDKLNDTLTASWDMYYGHAKAYHEENGNLEVPARYVTADGYALGRWIFNQKGIRKGTIAGKITDEQIRKLDKLGMVWELYSDLNWERNYAAAKAYYERFGDLTPPAKYVTEDGIALGSWLCSIRTWERAGVHRQYLSPERMDALNNIGMVWDVLDYLWEKNYMAAVEYYREHGNLDMPSSYVDSNGVRLGSWICRMRSLHAGTRKCRGLPPTEEQVQRLNRIGMVWEPRISNKWEIGYEAAKEYVKEYGNLLVPTLYISPSGFKLGAWIQRQRLVYRQKKILPDRRKRLERIGMVWEADSWESRFEKVKRYYEETGIINIDQKIVVDGVWIGKWIAMQKKAMDAGKLTDEQIALLRTLPIEQVGVKKDNWHNLYDDAVAYKHEYGNLLSIPKDYKGKSGNLLGNWVYTQRRKKRMGKLSEEQVRLLDDISFEWESVEESVWDKGYRHAKAYYDEHGHLEMDNRYKSPDGFSLGTWVFNYRRAYNGQKSTIEISDEQIKLLEDIGMVWKPDKVWDKKFAEFQAFYISNERYPKQYSRDNAEATLGRWLQSQRAYFRDGYLSPHKLKLLDSVGVDRAWLGARPTKFEKGYAVAKAHYDEHGNLDVATNYQHPSGFWLGSWVDKIRKKKDELSKEQVELLDAIGFVWEPTDNWEEKYAEAKAYFDEHGELPLEPKQCKNKSELLLCQWLRRQLLRRNNGKMPQEQIDRLTAIGMDWLNTVERTWVRGLNHCKEFRAKNGHLDVKVVYVCEDGYRLGEWLHSQRTHRKRLSEDKRQALIELGATGLT